MKTKSLIDYFTIRYAGKHDPDEVIEQLLGLDSILFEAYEKSPLDGYRKSKRFGGIFVCYDPCRYKIHNSEDEALPLDRMGVCISMSGDGCRTFENMSIHRFKEEGAFSYLMEQCYLNPDIFATRVDLAIDDHSGQLDMETIISNAFSDRIDSRITSIDIHVSKKEKRYNGRSLYIGAPSSAFRIRIYDKAKEQYKPGEDGYDNPWIRLEMVMRGKQAQGFIAAYCNSDDLGRLAVGILNDHVRFIDRDDSNITRCSTAQWWLDFVESLDAVKLLLPEPMQHTITKMNQWAMYQVSGSIAALVDAYGTAWLYDFLKFGRKRISPQKQSLVDDWKKRRVV